MWKNLFDSKCIAVLILRIYTCFIYLKFSKLTMEKKRRARINASLKELRKLLRESGKLDVSFHNSFLFWVFFLTTDAFLRHFSGISIFSNGKGRSSRSSGFVSERETLPQMSNIKPSSSWLRRMRRIDSASLGNGIQQQGSSIPESKKVPSRPLYKGTYKFSQWDVSVYSPNKLPHHIQCPLIYRKYYISFVHQSQCRINCCPW